MNWFNIIKDDEDDIDTYDVDEDYDVPEGGDYYDREYHKWPGLSWGDVDLPVGSQYGNNQFLEVLAASVEEQPKFETIKRTVETTRKKITTLKAQETKLRENLEVITQRIRDIPFDTQSAPEDRRKRTNLIKQKSYRVRMIKRIRGEIKSMLTDEYRKNLLDLQRHEALSDPLQLPKIARKYGWELPKELDNMLAQLRIQHGVSPKAFEDILATMGGDTEKTRMDKIREHKEYLDTHTEQEARGLPTLDEKEKKYVNELVTELQLAMQRINARIGNYGNTQDLMDELGVKQTQHGTHAYGDNWTQYHEEAEKIARERLDKLPQMSEAERRWRES